MSPESTSSSNTSFRMASAEPPTVQELQQHFGLTEEEARKALQNPQFVQFARSSITTTTAANEILAELMSAAKPFEELARKKGK